MCWRVGGDVGRGTGMRGAEKCFGVGGGKGRCKER